ncbi:hypothetical protein [Nocardioides ungokensis]|uniref:hypothetical protein n=1 Tax=Nocardioides ungokensis TaxID=1643322 RepID=UPI0015DF7E1C|nr:hypothetical protein [Nocardioides ungokensis]
MHQADNPIDYAHGLLNEVTRHEQELDELADRATLALRYLDPVNVEAHRPAALMLVRVVERVEGKDSVEHQWARKLMTDPPVVCPPRRWACTITTPRMWT